MRAEEALENAPKQLNIRHSQSSSQIVPAIFPPKRVYKLFVKSSTCCEIKTQSLNIQNGDAPVNVFVCRGRASRDPDFNCLLILLCLVLDETFVFGDLHDPFHVELPQSLNADRSSQPAYAVVASLTLINYK